MRSASGDPPHPAPLPGSGEREAAGRPLKRHAVTLRGRCCVHEICIGGLLGGYSVVPIASGPIASGPIASEDCRWGDGSGAPTRPIARPEGTNAGNVTGLAIGELREPLRTPTPLGYALPQTHVSDARTIAGGGAGVATLGRKGAALLWIRPPVSLRANRSCGAAVGAKTIVSPGVAALGAVEPGGRSWRSGSRVRLRPRGSEQRRPRRRRAWTWSL